MSKSRLERVLEHMINDEQERASKLLRDHILETARDIYASYVEEDENREIDMDEDLNISDPSNDFESDLKSINDEIDSEEYLTEDEEDDEREAFSDLNDEMNADDEMGLGDDDLESISLDGGSEDDDDFESMDQMDMEGDDDIDPEDGEVDLEVVDDRMHNVEDALDELRSAFDEIMDENTDGSEDSDEDEMSREFSDSDEDNDGDDDGDDEDKLKESFPFYNEPDGLPNRYNPEIDPDVPLLDPIDDDIDYNDLDALGIDNDDIRSLSGRDDYDGYRINERDLDESAMLKKYKLSNSKRDDNHDSPVRRNKFDTDGRRKSGMPVNFSGSEKRTGKTPSYKSMDVQGPQEQGGKFNKKISNPKNTPTKSSGIF